MIIAFDVDGTLIDYNEQPRRLMVLLAQTMLEWQFLDPEQIAVIVWSGGGKEYAEMWADRLGLHGAVCLAKFPESALPHVDIAFDDEKDTLLADQMLIVGRFR